MRSRTGSRILRASSGSRSASSSIEPLRSAKSTVTCFRSPSRLVRDARICWATWRGVYDSGETNRADAGVAARTEAPHSEQKLADAARDVPQLGHFIEVVAFPRGEPSPFARGKSSDPALLASTTLGDNRRVESRDDRSRGLG